MNNNSQKSGFKGYCTHQPFGGMRIPVPGQNAVMRDYARRQGLEFKLSVNELNFPYCYLMLDVLLDQMTDLEGFIITSLFMLPNSKSARRDIFQSILDHDCSLHIVFENLVVSDGTSWAAAEDIILVAHTAKSCPKNIPANLLPLIPGFRSFTN